MRIFIWDPFNNVSWNTAVKKFYQSDGTAFGRLSGANHAPERVVQLTRLGQLAVAADGRVDAAQVGQRRGERQSGKEGPRSETSRDSNPSHRGSKVLGKNPRQKPSICHLKAVF